MFALVTEALAYRALDALVALAPVAGLVVAAVFAVAALTKLADHGRTTAEFDALGVPRPGLAARLVPPAELLVAAALLVRPAVGAAAAGLALVAFSVVLAVAMRRGEAVSCGCLGPLSRAPISAVTLVRNGVLLVLAALASVGSSQTGMAVALPSVDVAVACGAAAVIGLAGHQLIVLRGQIGRIWSVELAGEAPTRGRRRPDSLTAPRSLVGVTDGTATSSHHQPTRRSPRKRATENGVVP